MSTIIWAIFVCRCITFSLLLWCTCTLQQEKLCFIKCIDESRHKVCIDSSQIVDKNPLSTTDHVFESWKPEYHENGIHRVVAPVDTSCYRCICSCHVNFWLWSDCANSCWLGRWWFSVRVRTKLGTIATSWNSHEIPGYILFSSAKDQQWLWGLWWSCLLRLE